MHCSDCEKRNIRFENNCYTVEQSMYVINEYKMKKKLLINICEKYNNDIYNHILSFLCNDCISCKINERTFGRWCTYSPTLIKYLLDTNPTMYKKYLYYEYIFDLKIVSPFDVNIVTPLHIALIINLDMAYYIIFSNLYEESMMNKYCRCTSIDLHERSMINCRCSFIDLHERFNSTWITPLQIICKKYTSLLSVLITTQKITEKSITNDILKFCMKHNTKSLIVFLTSNACSNIINNIINKTIRREYDHSFLYLIHHGLNLESLNDIETILRLDIISIEFINHIDELDYPTFLFYLIHYGSVSPIQHENCMCSLCITTYCINKIFTTLYETNKITRELLSIRDSSERTILMRCCMTGFVEITQMLLSLDACDEEILSIQDLLGLNALMLTLYSGNTNIKYVLLDSNKITKNIINQRTTYNKTIYYMLDIVLDAYFRYKLNKIYYSE